MTPALRAPVGAAMVGRMGFMEKAKNLLGKHDDKVDKGLDKAGEYAKRRFAGNDEKIDGFVDKAKGGTGSGDTTRQNEPHAAPPQAAPHDRAQGGEHGSEVPRGPQPDVPAGPGQTPPRHEQR